MKSNMGVEPRIVAQRNWEVVPWDNDDINNEDGNKKHVL
jgi:hypothetical protein